MIVVMDPQVYLLAKQKLCAAKCSEYLIDYLKEGFRNDINSERRYRNIQTVNDLLRILEKRDVLSNDNHDYLIKIANTLNVNDLNFSTDLKINNCGFVSPPPTGSGTVLNLTAKTKEERIYALICKEIGHKWKDLARGLEITEGEIDNLEQLYPQIPMRVTEILKYYQNENSDNGTWFGLLNALTFSRRVDLRQNVEKILST